MNQRHLKLPGELFQGEKPKRSLLGETLGWLLGGAVFILVFIGGILVAAAIVVLPVMALVGGL